MAFADATAKPLAGARGAERSHDRKGVVSSQSSTAQSQR
jgi:hypothetical protein